jgi:ribosomal protein S18 acetylase RimI-like enzyme
MLYLKECLAIARSLPDYFTGGGIAEMSKDLQQHRLYLAVEAGAVEGFAAVQEKNSRAAELTWIAVRPARRSRGIGTALIDFLVEDLNKKGIRLLQVKTLAVEADYPPYELTRRYYEKNRFLHLETVNPYPPWGTGNPCAIYVKIIGFAFPDR